MFSSCIITKDRSIDSMKSVCLDDKLFLLSLGEKSLVKKRIFLQKLCLNASLTLTFAPRNFIFQYYLE